MTSTTALKLYNAWFCPFAQRAWIALLYKEVQFEYVEQDPYDKSTEWLNINPRGLVPALFHNGKVICESSICIEYLEDAWPGRGAALLPKDPFEKAHVRMWSDYVAKKIVPKYYALLMKRSEEERSEAKNDILSSITEIQAAFSQEGAFFMGREMCMLDIILWPHFYRIQIVASYYRGFRIPEEPKYERILTWHKAMMDTDCVKNTLSDEVKLIQSYQRYADDTARSEVATAIRRGTAMP